MDPLATLIQTPEIIDHANMADYVSATGLGVAQYISKHIGGEKVYHIMEGVDPEIYRPTVATNEYLADISFIGTATPERMAYLDFLGKVGIKVRAYGQGFGSEVHGFTFNIVCSSAAAMLAINNEHTTQEYFSDRIFRLGACGAFVLHSFSPGMDKYFSNGEDVVYFNSPESLMEAIRFYFTPDKGELRRAIANNLRYKVLHNHTWENTVRKIIEAAEI